MRRPEFLARQGRCPSGFLGSIVGRVMAHETAADNAAAIELLHLTPGDHVLEVGFGHGRTIAAMTHQVANGFIAGVDTSPAMLRLATRANRAAITRGLVQLNEGDGQSLPYPANRFDKVLTVHTIYFWLDPIVYLQELRRVLRPGGRLVIGFRPKDQLTMSSFPSEIYTFRPVDEICGLLAEAGFPVTDRTEARPNGRRIALITAHSNT